MDDPEESIEPLRELSSGVADSSTLIYADRAGFLAVLAGWIELVVPEGVAREVGSLPESVTVVAAPVSEPAAERRSPAASVDDSVVRLARSRRAAVLSDDRKLIESARAAGLDYYNALALLEGALLNGRIEPSDYEQCHNQLLAIANYPPHILRYGAELHQAVLKF